MLCSQQPLRCYGKDLMFSTACVTRLCGPLNNDRRSLSQSIVREMVVQNLLSSEERLFEMCVSNNLLCPK